MKKIVFYISDHGYGHATRSLALIRNLAQCEVKIIIKTGRPLSFIKESIGYRYNIEFKNSQNDVGLILKENSFKPYYQKLKSSIENWINNWDQLIKSEINYMKTNEVDLIISDITPLVFPAAKEAGVKSIGISNFTWYDQYHKLLYSDYVIEKVGDAYRDADLFLKYPLSMGLKKIDEYEEVGFVSREFDLSKVREFKNQFESDSDLVFVGIGKSVAPTILNQIKFQKQTEYNWLFSSGIKLQGDNIYQIPETVTEAHNYIAACDYAITKAGWSTVAEAVLARVPMLLLKRPEIPEDTRIISEIESLNLGLGIARDDFFNLEITDKIEKLNQLQPQQTFENKSQKVAARILQFLYSTS